MHLEFLQGSGRRGRRASIAAFLACLALLSTVFGSRQASAHELAVDQLRFLLTSEGILRAQLLLDPELTGFPHRREAAAVLAFASNQVEILFDGHPVRASWAVRELYVRGGATSADSLVTELAVPAGARALSIRVGSALPGLVLSLQKEMVSRATFVGRGATSPSYFFDRTDQSWSLGGAERFGKDGVLIERERSESEQPSESTSADARGLQAASGQSSEAVGWGGTARVFWNFVGQGVMHIVPRGLDHVLFVWALVLGVGMRPRRVVLLLSGFTLAHTLTLGLGALGFQPLPAGLVEILIAVSIAWAGGRNVWAKPQSDVLALGVLAFGLLHGMGFAGALSGLSLPRGFFLVSLLGFNLGVELGQLIVVLWAVAVVALLGRVSRHSQMWSRAASLAICACGLLWTVERTSALLS